MFDWKLRRFSFGVKVMTQELAYKIVTSFKPGDFEKIMLFKVKTEVPME